ncbi:MAG: type II toxin-antitoxin system prevent-host-death family antitoxin [Propionibacteriaceae bacterium]|nr:type II toxin-antitoxin system prevent-host-death family antitoxin [Propionibacteriaceae bacterium]
MTLLVGIRELRQNPANAIATVRSGETVMITDRGVNVAQLVPAESTRHGQLIASGKIRPALKDWRHLAAPTTKSIAGEQGASERLAAMRDAQRY